LISVKTHAPPVADGTQTSRYTSPPSPLYVAEFSMIDLLRKIGAACRTRQDGRR
jgi:hypothetical protein